MRWSWCQNKTNYRPLSEAGEGYIFTGICLSNSGGVTMDQVTTPPPSPLLLGPGQNIYPPPPQDQVRTSTPSPPRTRSEQSTPCPPSFLGPGQNIYANLFIPVSDWARTSDDAPSRYQVRTCYQNNAPIPQYQVRMSTSPKQRTRFELLPSPPPREYMLSGGMHRTEMHSCLFMYTYKTRLLAFPTAIQ